MHILYSPKIRNNAVDEFLTPPELAERCIEELILRSRFDTDARITILDVGANTGTWGKAARSFFPNARIIGVEIMEMPQPEGYDAWYVSNFLDWEFNDKVDLVLGNPPYSNTLNGPRQTVAEDFVWRAKNLLNPSGVLGFLLRINFASTLGRYWKDNTGRSIPGLHQAWHYHYSLHLTKRPSFYKYDSREEGKGNNEHDYSFFIWFMEWQEKYGITQELDWDYISTDAVSPHRLSR